MEWVRGAMVGKGSFGIVSLATTFTERNQRQVIAVKSAALSQSSSLQKEKLILTQLKDCPQILHYLGDDITVENGASTYNLFLEYAFGGTVFDWLKRSGGRLPESDVRQVTRSVLHGLNYIHGNGFIHCDIKPQNILLCSDGIKIADFGLAKRAGEKGNGTHLQGTPLYMSPESVAEGDYEAPADIWSLGCAVTEMITGKPAWIFQEGADVGNLLFRIGLGEELPEIPCELSEEGRDFLGKCFVRDSKKRWTAEMLLGHPFVAGAERMEGLAVSFPSPRSAFDFPGWNSLQSLSTPSVCSPVESFSGLQVEFKSEGLSSTGKTPADRILQLAGEKSPNWSCWDSDGNWVITREADSSVSQSRIVEVEEEEEEEESKNGEIVTCIGRSTEEIGSVGDDSLLILEMMMGERNREGNSSPVKKEDLLKFNITTSSTSDSFAECQSCSNGEDETTPYFHESWSSIPDVDSRKRMFEQLKLSSSSIGINRSISSGLMMVAESDFFSYFGDNKDCNDSYSANQYKHRTSG